MGMGSLLVPFLTNADVDAIAGGDDMSASVWTRIESHVQEPTRVFPMSFDAGNSPAPAAYSSVHCVAAPCCSASSTFR